jgi:hypothetical protein
MGAKKALHPKRGGSAIYNKKWPEVTSVQIVGNLVEIAVSPRPGKRLREHRLIVQQVPVGRTSPLNRRRRAGLLRTRRFDLRHAAGLAGVEVHGGLPTAAAAAVAAFVAAFTTATATATATAPAAPAATSSAATFTTARSTLTLVVVGTGALRTLLLRNLRRARLLMLLVGPMTALLLAMTTATALLRTVTAALLLAMSATTTLLVTMTATALLWGAVANLALGLRALPTTTLLGTALVGGGFFRGEFHGKSFGQRHFAFAALRRA